MPHSDGRPVVVGKTHIVDGDIVLCNNGLHASKRIIDALFYAGGSFIYQVELSGKIIEDSNKMVASHRKYLAGGIDCKNILRKFSRQCALDVIHLWDAPDIVKQYLKTGDESARSAARSAAESAQNERLEKMVRDLFTQQDLIDCDSMYYNAKDKKIDALCDADAAKSEEFCGPDGEGEPE